jgi:streptogramin lyase
MACRPHRASIRGAVHGSASKSCLLLATMAASGLVGCGGGSGSQALPQTPAQNASIVGNGSALTQTLASSMRVGIAEFPIPTANAEPSDIAAGPDGDLWFTEALSNKIGKVTAGGKFTEYPVPVPAYAELSGITEGPDGNLWFGESATGGTLKSFSTNKQIGKITTDGRLTEYPLPGAMGANGITAGPDGDLWFGENHPGRHATCSGQVAKTTTSGKITEFPSSLVGCPGSFVAGRDGNLWFTEGKNTIGKITTGGSLTTYHVPNGPMGYPYPNGIALGPDGNLWFTESGGNKIGKITTNGTITEYPIPTANAGPYAIAAGRDGNLWFTEYSSNHIGKISTNGAITEYPIPTANAEPMGIAVGLNGNLWFTEYSGNKIGKINLANS